ncbi:MAG: DUF5993 family protein [Chlamydiales bacterium]
MMAALFAIIAFSMGSAFFGKRALAIIFLVVGIALCWVMLAFHATEALQINW